MKIDPAERDQLLSVARASILEALAAGTRVDPSAAPTSSRLSANGASFVTLTTEGGVLRGCCGSVVATRPLAEDVWRNAQRTAFEDPRFPALQAREVAVCALAISVLGPLEAMQVESEQALIAALRPGIDGLLLRHAGQQATFLPKVWEKLPDADLFVSQLKQKMGLPGDFWHAGMRVFRYDTVEFSGELGEGPVIQ